MRKHGLFSLALPLVADLHAAGSPAVDPATRARSIEAQMTDAERHVLTHGIMPMRMPAQAGTQREIPADAVPGAGYVAGIPRLGVPALKETDASLGVAYFFGLRGDAGATALPSGMAMASTWNPSLIYRGGAMIGGEARAAGFNVLLAGGVNLARDPRNGRTFEYLGEDPLLAGSLAGAAIAGIQSNHIISTIKHLAFNGQETARTFANVTISDASARQSDLLAFQIAIERGQPLSVMCAYNQVNSEPACGSEYLLNSVLKRDWRYPGFVMSDWGAVHGVHFALKGLDQQSGSQLDARVFFDTELGEAAAKDAGYRERLRDMNRRILYAIFAAGLDAHPATPGGQVDAAANASIAQDVASESIVLLRNERAVLPLSSTVKRIAVIGGYADIGVLSGGGSSQVQMKGGPAAVVPQFRESSLGAVTGEQLQRGTSPLAAIQARAASAEVIFRNGFYLAEAVEQARRADAVIVFANQWQGEGRDLPDLSLPRGQDALIEAVAAANPNTVVVLQTGTAVLMPWLGRTAAVVEAWYPGARGAEAIAAVLFGDSNPSGRLPMTFPASLAQLPRPKLDGSDTLEPAFFSKPLEGQTLDVNYDIEGADVGYRWWARQGQRALFPFGHGLSYTSFSTSGLSMRGLTARLTVQNTGAREGSTVIQLYLVSATGDRRQRLAAFQKVQLKPGESRAIELIVEPRLIAEWANSQWLIRAGRYAFALGEDAERLATPVEVSLSERRWRP